MRTKRQGVLGLALTCACIGVAGCSNMGVGSLTDGATDRADLGKGGSESVQPPGPIAAIGPRPPSATPATSANMDSGSRTRIAPADNPKIPAPSGALSPSQEGTTSPGNAPSNGIPVAPSTGAGTQGAGTTPSSGEVRGTTPSGPTGSTGSTPAGKPQTP